jgi:hypothetical protein
MYGMSSKMNAFGKLSWYAATPAASTSNGINRSALLIGMSRRATTSGATAWRDRPTGSSYRLPKASAKI